MPFAYWLPFFQLNSSICALRQLSFIENRTNLLSTIYGIFESVLSYEIILQGFTIKQNVDRIFVVQKTALRIVWELDSDGSSGERFRARNVLTVPSLIIYFSVIKTLIINKSCFETFALCTIILLLDTNLNYLHIVICQYNLL